MDGVHFTRAHLTFEEIGHRALASNLSDIAAMGARPVLATVALGVPQDMRPDQLLAVYAGIDQLARLHACVIAGGDIVRSPSLLLSITIVGEVRRTHIKRRSRARKNDILVVTGPLGASRAGLDSFAHVDALDGELLAQARRKHAMPEPRLAEGKWLAASEYVHAMMDLSDGISVDVARLGSASKLAAELSEIPVAPSAQAMAAALGCDAVDYAVAGGEDFELLAAVAPRAVRHLSERFKKRFGRPLYPIGRLHEGTGVSLRNGSSLMPLYATGWDHIAP